MCKECDTYQKDHMITDEIGGHKIERYNSVEEILIPRYMHHNRLIMIESGIGSTPAAIDSHDKQIIAYAKASARPLQS